MKTVKMLGCALLLLLFVSPVIAQEELRTKARGEYTIVDLSTGEAVDIYYDTLSWKTKNKKTLVPVDYYVIKYSGDTRPDTVHGVTGIIVNDMIWKNAEGKWMLNEAVVKWDGNDWKMKDKYGRKVKWEKGNLKIKDWNSKYKSQAGDETKYKEEWDKIKWKESGDVKTEMGTQKTKVKSDQ